MARERYRVMRGINYHPAGKTAKPERRAEPGDVVDDLPADSLPWLLERRAIMAAEPSDAEVSSTEEV